MTALALKQDENVFVPRIYLSKTSSFLQTELRVPLARSFHYITSSTDFAEVAASEAVEKRVNRRFRMILNRPFLPSELSFPTAPWAEVGGVIDAWGQLEDGWDGEEALSPLAEAVSAARRFAAWAALFGMPVGKPYIAADGEIGFEWRQGDAISTISFLRTGEMFAYRPGADGISFSGSLADVRQLTPFIMALSGSLVG